MLDFVNSSLRRLQKEEKSYESIRNKNKVIKNIPFNSTTKKMTVVIELEPEKRVRVFTKGASECIIDDCNTMLDKGNQVVELDLNKREKLKDTVLKTMAQQALRTIALAYKDLTYEEYKKQFKEE
jgi:magnesium-transporting ATPase (P-type)